MAHLCELADIIRGVTFDKEEATDLPGNNLLPILRAGNIQETLFLDQGLVFVPQRRVSQDQRLRNGDIAICMSSGSIEIVGKTAVIERDWNGSVGAFCAIIRPRNGAAVPGYVAAWLRSSVFRQWTRRADGLNIKNIRRSELGQLEVQLPSEDEQRRIVDILDRAASIRRLRRQAQEMTRQIIPALFNKMFGNPQTNPFGWPIETIGDLFLVRGGKRLPKGEQYSDEPTPFRYIRGTNIHPNHIAVSALVYLSPEIQRGIARYTVNKGDVVITIAGKIGVAAPVGEDLDGVNLTENAALLRLKKYGVMSPFFLSCMLNSVFVKRQIEVLTGRVTIGKLALERLKTVVMCVPPLPLQRQFEQSVLQLRALESSQLAAEVIVGQAVKASGARMFSA